MQRVGTSQEGFDAEWRGINLADPRRRPDQPGELFDEADLDAALARFEELAEQKPPVEKCGKRGIGAFPRVLFRPDWDAIAETVALTFCIDDRRLAVNSGLSKVETR